MARIKIDMPASYVFSTEYPIRVSDINYAGHMGNDAMLSAIHEARIRFFKHFNYTEMDVEGLGIIMSDSAIIYKAEVFHGDTLRIEVTVGDFNRYGCDIFYQITNSETQALVVQAKTGIVFFDYAARKVHPLPPTFQQTVLANDTEQS